MPAKGELTRERLLAVAARLIREKGMGATSISDLLSACGVTRGSLYFHFPGKDELGLAVLEQARADFRQFLKEALAGPTPRARLHGFFDVVLRTHRRTKFVGGCLFGNTALEMGDGDRRYADVVAQVFDEWTATLTEVIAEGQRAGEFRRSPSAGALAGHVVAAIEGGIMLARLHKKEKPLRECLNCLRVLLEPDPPQANMEQ